MSEPTDLELMLLVDDELPSERRQAVLAFLASAEGSAARGKLAGLRAVSAVIVQLDPEALRSRDDVSLSAAASADLVDAVMKRVSSASVADGCGTDGASAAASPTGPAEPFPANQKRPPAMVIPVAGSARLQGPTQRSATPPSNPPRPNERKTMTKKRNFHRSTCRCRIQWPINTPMSVTNPVTWVVRITNPQ